MIEGQRRIGRSPDSMPLAAGGIVCGGDNPGTPDMDRAAGIEMGQGQRLGIAGARIRGPCPIGDHPRCDLAVTIGKGVHQTGGDGISGPAIHRQGCDRETSNSDIACGGMQDEVANCAGIPDPARAVEGIGPDGGLPGDDEIVLGDIDQRIGQCALAPGAAGERLDIETQGADGEVHRRIVHNEGCRGIGPGAGARNPFAPGLHIDLDAAEIDVARNIKAEVGMGIHQARAAIRAPRPEGHQAADLDIMRVGKGHSGTGGGADIVAAESGVVVGRGIDGQIAEDLDMVDGPVVAPVQEHGRQSPRRPAAEIDGVCPIGQ